MNKKVIIFAIIGVVVLVGVVGIVASTMLGGGQQRVSIDRAVEQASRELQGVEGIVKVEPGKCGGRDCIKVHGDRELQDIPARYRGYPVEVVIDSTAPPPGNGVVENPVDPTTRPPEQGTTENPGDRATRTPVQPTEEKPTEVVDPPAHDLPIDPDARLLLKSGFEDGVSLGNVYEKQLNRPVNDWRRSILGSDNNDAFWNWESLPAEFHYAVPASENIEGYVANRIEEVIGRSGEPTRALYMGVSDYYRDKNLLGGLTRNQYVIYPDENFDRAYIRYWIKFQPDLNEIMPQGEGSWRIVMEWFENGNDYRFNLAVLVGGDGELYWKVAGELNHGRGWENEDWKIDNHEVPVPVGEWFLLESYFEHDEENGRVWFAINGKTIADYTGRNKLNGKIETWLPLKVYTGAEELDRAGGVAYQWIDDVEIYDGIPEGRLGVLD